MPGTETQQGSDSWNNKDVLVFRTGTHNGVVYDDAAFDAIVKRTHERGVDIIWAPDEDAAEVVHSLKYRGHGRVKLDTLYESLGKWGRELRGKLTDVSDWMKGQLEDGAWAYVSPTVGYNTVEEMEKNPALGFLRFLTPTPDPAIVPQEALMADSHNVYRRFAIEVEPIEEPKIEHGKLTSGKFSMEWDGTGEEIAKTLTQTKETVMAEEVKDTEVKEEVKDAAATETTDSGDKGQSHGSFALGKKGQPNGEDTKTSDSGKKVELSAEQKAEVTQQLAAAHEVIVMASAKTLMAQVKLTKEELGDKDTDGSFVAVAMSQDAFTKNKEGKTQLDYYLAGFEARAPFADLSLTAEPNAEGKIDKGEPASAYMGAAPAIQRHEARGVKWTGDANSGKRSKRLAELTAKGMKFDDAHDQAAREFPDEEE